MADWTDASVAYWHWLVLGLVLIGVELLVPLFVLLWLGTAAIFVGALLALWPLPVVFQLVLWILLSVGFVACWHVFISPRMKTKTLAGLAREAILGQVGMVIFYSTEQGRGKLKFPAPVVGNDEWEFIFHEPLRNGDKVRVVDISGNSLLVKRL